MLWPRNSLPSYRKGGDKVDLVIANETKKKRTSDQSEPRTRGRCLGRLVCQIVRQVQGIVNPCGRLQHLVSFSR